MNPPGPVLDWLLEDDDPCLRLRVLQELLDAPADDPGVRQARATLQNAPAVQAILKKMTPYGTWLHKKSGTRQMIGDGVEYTSFATTHYCLAYLAELGLDRTHPDVALAAERYLSLQQPDGDWWMHLSCLLGYNLRTFVLLGYREDRRVQRALTLLLETERHDGGYLCELHEGKYKTRPVKSCFRGAVKVLLGFSEFPQVWQHPRCLALVNYFLERGGIYRRSKPDSYVTREMVNLSFPITYGANSFEVLLALARMGTGGDARLGRAWDDLAGRADADGFYRLDRTYTGAPWKVGGQGERNKWVTFYAWLALKTHPQPLP